MGYSQLNSFFGMLFGFAVSGYLLNAWCPDPKTLPPDAQAAWAIAIQGRGPMPEQYAHAHYVWFVFAAIGLLALLALIAYNAVFAVKDRRSPAVKVQP